MSSRTTGESPRSRRLPTIRDSRLRVPGVRWPATKPSRVLAHGTTVATNALLERRGARVALVATEGFADEIEIARQVASVAVRPVRRPARAARCRARFGSACRAASTVAVASSRRSTAASRRSPTQSTRSRSACCTPISTRATSRRSPMCCAPRAATHVVCSHEVSPEFREYERMVTTVVEAFLEPVCAPVSDAASRRSRPKRS